MIWFNCFPIDFRHHLEQNTVYADPLKYKTYISYCLDNPCVRVGATFPPKDRYLMNRIKPFILAQYKTPQHFSLSLLFGDSSVSPSPVRMTLLYWQLLLLPHGFRFS